MNKLVRRLLSAALVGALTAALCLTASAYGDFKYPSAYWPLHTEWDEAVAAKDPDRVIAAAQKTYDLLNPLGLGQDVCENLEPKAQRASWACEIKGDIAGAITWTERQRAYAKWLDESVDGYDYTDTLQSIDSRLDYLRAARTVTVYAQAGSGNGGAWYGVPADGSRSDTNAALIYITFNDPLSVEYWLDYYSNNSASFRKAADGGVIEVAWNFSPESTAGAQAVLNASTYISESLRALGGLDATVLLRLGAEMNNWSDCDPQIYKQAFQKVATAARAYRNIQMVFSPNDISDRNADIADFYPGDSYVDWVGLSTYHNSQYVSYDRSLGVASYSFDYNKYYDDAFYGVGIYDHDPLITIKPIVELAKSHNKPVMISECGFAYRSDTGADLTSYAAAQLNWFYSYLNMVYPEVKAVFYFDSDSDDSGYSYRLSGSSMLNSAYEKAIRDNGAYLADVNGSATGWTTLDKAALSGLTSVKLAAYASFPGQHSTSVRYFLDGREVYSSSQAPFYYTLDLSSLSGGSHTLRVDAAGGQFSGSSQSYTFTVAGAQAPETQTPSTPSTQTPVTQPANAMAMPTNDRLTSDGVLRNPTVYKINDSNYFKIRDLAAILNGTAKQFSVGYSETANAVTATSGQPYQMTGTELAGEPQGGSKNAMASNDAIYINGAKAIVEVYKIDGSNYFKLRDLGKALDFYVGWTAEQGMFIDTTKGYSE